MIFNFLALVVLPVSEILYLPLTVVDICMFCITGYQAEDAEMVTVSSPATCTDADTVPLYPAVSPDVSIATSSLAAGSANDSGISAGAIPVTMTKQLLPYADVCDNVLPQHTAAELQEFGDENTENGEL